MSIHVLKRKTNTRYSGNHSKTEGFSLNNSRRLHTPMEQSHTPLKGNVAIGNGGCCGTYSNDLIYTQNVNSDPFNQVRPSVKSYSAYLNSKKKCQIQTLYTENPKPTPSILYPNTVFQSTTTEDYQSLLNIKKSCLTDLSLNTPTGTSNNCSNLCVGNYNQKIGPLDASTYIETRLKKIKCLAPPIEVIPKRIQRNTTSVPGCKS